MKGVSSLISKSEAGFRQKWGCCLRVLSSILRKSCETMKEKVAFKMRQEMAQSVKGLGTSMRTRVLILGGHTGKSGGWLWPQHGRRETGGALGLICQTVWPMSELLIQWKTLFQGRECWRSIQHRPLASARKCSRSDIHPAPIQRVWWTHSLEIHEW